MQSGLGLFFNGNDPSNLHNSCGTSTYVPHLPINQTDVVKRYRVVPKLPQAEKISDSLGMMASAVMDFGVSTINGV
jgi:hypothetical protein